MTRFKRGSAAQEVCDALRREILTLQLEPGSPLDETGLSQRFDVSRSPIREALNRLLAERLVEARPNRSMIVAPVDIANFAAFIEALDLQQRHATRLAARHRTISDVEHLWRLAEAYNNAAPKGDALEILQANYDFHLAVAVTGKNPYVIRHYGELLSQARRLLHIHIEFRKRQDERTVLDDQHRDFVAAIEDGDADRADAVAHAHSMQFHDRFLQALRYLPDSGLSVEPATGLKVLHA